MLVYVDNYFFLCEKKIDNCPFLIGVFAHNYSDSRKILEDFFPENQLQEINDINISLTVGITIKRFTIMKLF